MLCFIWVSCMWQHRRKTKHQPNRKYDREHNKWHNRKYTTRRNDHKNEENTTNSESNNNSSEGSNNNGQQNTETPTQTPVTPEINNDSVPNIVPNIPNVEVEKDKAIKGEAQFTVIPEGGTYKTADGKTLVAGDTFPIAPASGDTFFYNGFKYVQGGFILNNQFCARYKNMWFVYANKSGIENLDDSCTSINGQTVTLRTAADLDFQ